MYLKIASAKTNSKLSQLLLVMFQKPRSAIVLRWELWVIKWAAFWRFSWYHNRVCPNNVTPQVNICTLLCLQWSCVVQKKQNHTIIQHWVVLQLHDNKILDMLWDQQQTLKPHTPKRALLRPCVQTYHSWNQVDWLLLKRHLPWRKNDGACPTTNPQAMGKADKLVCVLSGGIYAGYA